MKPTCQWATTTNLSTRQTFSKQLYGDKRITWQSPLTLNQVATFRTGLDFVSIVTVEADIFPILYHVLRRFDCSFAASTCEASSMIRKVANNTTIFNLHRLVAFRTYPHVATYNNVEIEPTEK